MNRYTGTYQIPLYDLLPTSTVEVYEEKASKSFAKPNINSHDDIALRKIEVPVPGTRHQAPGTRHQAPGTRVPVGCTRYRYIASQDCT